MKQIIILLALLTLSVNSFAQKEKEHYKVKLLEECNTELSDYGTTFYGEDQMIYSSPTKKSKIIKNIWLPNEQPFLELFVADIAEDGELVNRKKINPEVNSRYHESNVAFTKNLSTVYFSRDKYYERHLDKDEEKITHIAMYRAEVVTPGYWTNIVEMPFNNENYCVGHPTLSADDKTLYFSSEIDGSDDIFKVNIYDDGTYSNPIKLGQDINTSGSERFPFMGENNTLYFSSDREGGFGKLDIYNIRLDGRSSAKNLGLPINSYNDDFSFTKRKGTNKGYFSSNRSLGKGDDDIYYFEGVEDIPCSQLAEGIVTNKKNGKKIPNALVVLYDKDGDELDSQVVGRDAKFSFEVDCSENYKVHGSKENYSFDEKEFLTTTDLELELDLDLSIQNQPKAPVVVQQPTIIYQTAPAPTISYVEPPVDLYESCQAELDRVKNIYFELDKSLITYSAAIELDKVIIVMKRCNNININASSHTDCRASDQYNEALSQRRAQATVDYIADIGNISKQRLNAIGFGEKRLTNYCADGVKCSESEHQKNRRTQFEISNY